MKKLIALTVLSLGLAQSALALTTASCSNEKGETLKVVESYHRTSISSVQATLQTTEFTALFQGTHDLTSGYSIVDGENQNVDLKISKATFNYGGRCGRCSPDPVSYTYAKLTLANGTEFNFTCN